MCLRSNVNSRVFVINNTQVFDPWSIYGPIVPQKVEDKEGYLVSNDGLTRENHFV